MIIQSIPSEFQPSYSNGENMEEIFFKYFSLNKDSIKTDRIYIPVFWTSYYVTHECGKNIQNLLNWLNNLDNSKKYFTIVQYASGIIMPSINNIDILVFSAGGGLNENNFDTIVNFYGITRNIFIGNKGDYDIPLLRKPDNTFNKKLSYTDKDIYCSFMGRYDTHRCRMVIKEKLQSNNLFKFYDSSTFEEYNNILKRSIFSLAPRGYGYTSFRLYESILEDSIPIYVWDDKIVLPFSDILNWEEFCIIINEKDIDSLPDVLSKINISKYQEKLSSVKHMFSFDYIFEYISNKIFKKISLAIPYYNNSKYILETINTALFDHRIDEIVICDDKSDDIEILENILSSIPTKKIKFFKNDINLGCYHNKINTITKCLNDWAILLDSDNIINKDYVDVLYNIELWEYNTIYAPVFARTFPGEESVMLNYKKFSNKYITKQVYIDNFQDINFQCLINNCNYFLPTKKYKDIMTVIQHNYDRKYIDCLDSAVLFTDWLYYDNKILVVDKLEYKHRTHANSNYVVSPSRIYEEYIKNMLFNKVNEMIM